MLAAQVLGMLWMTFAASGMPAVTVQLTADCVRVDVRLLRLSDDQYDWFRTRTWMPGRTGEKRTSLPLSAKWVTVWLAKVESETSSRAFAPVVQAPPMFVRSGESHATVVLGEDGFRARVLSERIGPTLDVEFSYVWRPRFFGLILGCCPLDHEICEVVQVPVGDSVAVYLGQRLRGYSIRLVRETVSSQMAMFRMDASGLADCVHLLEEEHVAVVVSTVPVKRPVHVP